MAAGASGLHVYENGIGAIITDFTKDSYLNSVKEIDSIIRKHSRREIFDKIRSVASKYRNFSRAAEVYKEIYDPQNK